MYATTHVLSDENGRKTREAPSFFLFSIPFLQTFSAVLFSACNVVAIQWSRDLSGHQLRSSMQRKDTLRNSEVEMTAVNNTLQDASLQKVLSGVKASYNNSN